MEAIQGKSWSQISDEIGGARRRPMNVAEAAEAIKGLQKPDGSHRSFSVEMRKAPRSGKIVIRTSNLAVGYPDKPLFAAEDLELLRLECAALIGPNGSGKTTFLKTILGEVEPLAGQVRLGASLEIGYLAQAHERLNPDNRVIDELIRHHEMLVHEARNYLAQYLFQGDDVYKRVESLSGGERGRLALAILALEGSNFLLLDEPTNHLDIPAQEMLQSVLENFEGTILLVTHDRYLVDRLATQLWLLEDGQLRVFKGSYQEYLAERERQENLVKETASKERDIYRQRKSEARAQEYAERDRVTRLAQVEKDITGLEAKLKEIGYQIQEASNDQAFDKIKNLSLEYAAVESRLEKRIQEWEDLARE
jgi:ATP-binding cassette subfamily F protein 3